MGRLLILVLLVAVVAWMIMSRRRPRAQDSEAKRAKPPQDEPAPMLACAHCGVHLPQSDAVIDAGGKPYCTEAHRLAGPR